MEIFQLPSNNKEKKMNLLYLVIIGVICYTNNVNAYKSKLPKFSTSCSLTKQCGYGYECKTENNEIGTCMLKNDKICLKDNDCYSGWSCLIIYKSKIYFYLTC